MGRSTAIVDPLCGCGRVKRQAPHGRADHMILCSAHRRRFPGAATPARPAASVASSVRLATASLAKSSAGVRLSQPSAGRRRAPRPGRMYPVPDQSRVSDVLLNSPADWISPGFDDRIFPHCRWYTDPPASGSRKVVITDTDHYAPGSGDAL
jgi:hypothetical protein